MAPLSASEHRYAPSELARRDLAGTIRPARDKETEVKTQTRLRAAGALALGLMSANFAQAQPASPLQVRSWASTCANCHGTDGKSVSTDAGLTRLAGLDKAYIVEQLTAFREGKRPATIMHQLTKGYTPEQLDAIAGYFAAQK
jgi:cytochrome c553